MISLGKISSRTAEALCRSLTAKLPDYFGLPEVNEQYAIGVRNRHNFAAKIDDEHVGLISIDFPYPKNGNIYWMAVRPDYQSQGVGRHLIEIACQFAVEQGADTMTVETLAPSESDENYLKTYYFYQSNGFKPLINLKPQGYEWNMVYMVRLLNAPVPTAIQSNTKALIQLLEPENIPVILETFQKANWPKHLSLFENYLKEQKENQRIVWVAWVDGQCAGYVTLEWKSAYEPFAHRNIPEIADLNVLPSFRKIGIGSKLLETAEKEAATRSNIVGIGVGLYGGADGGYGMAQRLYVNRGYIPDGKGITYHYQPVIPGHEAPVDDDLILWFTKKLNEARCVYP